MADGSARIKTKVTAPPTVPTIRAEELTGDEATCISQLYHVRVVCLSINSKLEVYELEFRSDCCVVSLTKELF